MAATPHAGFAVVVDGWFDGEKRHSGPTTVTVTDGHISDIATGDHSADLAARGLTIERGAFLLPGLVDAHVHLFLDGAPTDQKLRSEHLEQTHRGRACQRPPVAQPGHYAGARRR